MPTWLEKKNRDKEKQKQKKKPYVVSFFVFDMTRTKRNSFTINAVGTSGGGKGARVQGDNSIFFGLFLFIFASELKSGLSVVPRVVFWKVLTCLPFCLFLCIFEEGGDIRLDLGGLDSVYIAK